MTGRSDGTVRRSSWGTYGGSSIRLSGHAILACRPDPTVPQSVAQMDGSQVLARTKRLHAAATASCATACELCRTARATLASLLAQVRKNPYRRAFRLGRGGSDSAPTSSTTPTPERKETMDRRCPYCQSAHGIKALGQVEVHGGLIRSLYCCAICDRAFFYVRKPIDFLSKS